MYVHCAEGGQKKDGASGCFPWQAYVFVLCVFLVCLACCLLCAAFMVLACIVCLMLLFLFPRLCFCRFGVCAVPGCCLLRIGVSVLLLLSLF